MHTRKIEFFTFSDRDQAERARQEAMSTLATAAPESHVRLHERELDPALAIELRTTRPQRRTDRILLRSVLPLMLAGLLAGLVVDAVLGTVPSWTWTLGFAGLVMALVVAFVRPAGAVEAIPAAEAALERGDVVLSAAGDTDAVSRVETIVARHEGKLLTAHTA